MAVIGMEPDAEIVVDPLIVVMSRAHLLHAVVPDGGRFLVVRDRAEALLEDDRDQMLLPVDREFVRLARRDQHEGSQQPGHQDDDQQRAGDDLRNEPLAPVGDREQIPGLKAFDQHRSKTTRSNMAISGPPAPSSSDYCSK